MPNWPAGGVPLVVKLIDDAMYAIEKDNPKLKGKLPRDYARRGIAPERLGGLIDQIASMPPPLTASADGITVRR
jgi:type I restriction enzyme M protein